MTNVNTSSRAATITRLDDGVRFSLRLRRENLGAVGDAIGFSLPERIGGRTGKNGRTALCLGPDEWLVLADAHDRETLVASFAEIATRVPHALCDISDRELAYRVAGPRVLDLLATGCPLNLAQMPVGEGTRTIFDSVQVVLIREAEDSFRLETWRSFAPHVVAILERAVRELDTGL